jgi:putative two-component system response regulator
MALSYFAEVLLGIRQHRAKEIAALISIGSAAHDRDDEYQDLLALTHTEAVLRAASAEVELSNARRDMLERLAVTASLKEDATGAHGYRVGSLCSLIAAELGWPPSERNQLELAARLHDIGKVAIPDTLVLGDRVFEKAERELMQSHTAVGAELLSNSNTPDIRLAAEAARFHHEWWNGSGYPSGLAGARIPLHCRIVAIADVFDALTHGRRYAPAWSMKQALSEIEASAGRQFDPTLVRVFVSLICRLSQEHRDLDEFLERAAGTSPYFAARNKIHALLGANYTDPSTQKTQGAGSRSST